jgi:hypothetical protein
MQKVKHIIHNQNRRSFDLQVSQICISYAPMFAKCDNPFPLKQKKGGANITRQQVAKIEQLRSQGVSPTLIAEQVGVSAQTVHRRSERSGRQPRPASSR